MNNSKRIILVGAHPDDEWYGLGGTLLRLMEEEATITIILVSKGERDTDDGIIRLEKSKKLAQTCNFEFVYLGYKGNKIRDMMPEIIRDLDEIFNDIQPDLVFTHFNGDDHQDHKAVNESVVASLRRLKNTSLLLIETPYKHGFQPNFYVDITGFLNKKIELFYRFFEDEIDQNPDIDLDKLRFLARTHGNMIGTKYAEGFVLQKGVLK